MSLTAAAAVVVGKREILGFNFKSIQRKDVYQREWEIEILERVFFGGKIEQEKEY